MANFSFDANQVAPDSGQLDPLPAGWYDMYVKESEIKPTSDGTGTRLVLGFGFMDPNQKNRKVTINLNIRNKSEQAQNIALGQLSALCHAVGVLAMQDTAQLHNIPFKGKLKVIAADGQYAAKNDMAAFKHMQDPSVPTGPAALSAAVPGAPVTVRPPPPPASAHSPVPQRAAPPMPQVQQAPMQQPPMQQAAPVQQMQPAPVQQMQPAPVAQAPQQWAQPAAPQPWAQPAAPVAAAQAPQVEQPAWANAPVQQVAAAPAQQLHAAQPAVDTSVGGTIVPPWMQAVASPNPPF